jgi:hypothetical protein
MREFADIRHEPGLKKFFDSSLGTLYTISDISGVPKVMIRHFDGDIPISLVKPFADLVQAVQKWINRNPPLSQLVRIEQPIEVGCDFIARPFHIYYVSTDSYVYWEDQPEIPEELEKMRKYLREAIGKSLDPKDAIIEGVLKQSLLGPTGKTYFDEIEGKFVVVEPKITREDVENWVLFQRV